MAVNLNGSSDKIRFNSAPVLTYPISIALWIRPNSTSQGTFAGLFSSISDSDWLRIYTTTKVAMDQNGLGGAYYGGVESSASLTVGEWHHVGLVWTDLSSRWVYLDGVGAQNTTSLGIPGVWDRFSFGALDRPSITEFGNGDIAECGVWNVSLTTEDFSQLAKGVSPKKIRPQDLILYDPLVGRGTDSSDLVGGLAGVKTGTAATAHPRVYS